MQDKSKTTNNNWVRCKGCGHKLFKTLPNTQAIIKTFQQFKLDAPEIEIKCSSCKEINEIYFVR